MEVIAMLEAMEQSITLTNGTMLNVNDECLAGHPITLRFRRAIIISISHGTGVQRATVRDKNGEEWTVGRYALRKIRR